MNYMTPVRYVIEPLRTQGAAVMSGVTTTAAAGGPIASAPPSPPPPRIPAAARPPSLPSEGSIYLENKCKYSLNFGIRYYNDEARSWQTRWYNPNGGSYGRLVDQDDAPITTANSIVYYWANATGSNYFWQGSESNSSDRTYEYNGMNYRFKMVKLDKSQNGERTLTLSCDKLP